MNRYQICLRVKTVINFIIYKVMLSIVMMSAHDIIISSMESLKKRLSQALFSTEKQKSLEWV